jgi:hypothetical protein
MKYPARPIVFVVIALLFSGETQATDSDSTADKILTEAKLASGGSAWDRIQGWHETGLHNGARYDTWLNPIRYGMAYRQTRDDKTSWSGFDGVAAWARGPDGVVHINRDANSISSAKQTAYLSINGFFFRNRFPATAVFVGERVVSGRRVDVLDITPKGCKPLEFWFDRETHLMVGAVDRSGTTAIVATGSDYHRVGGLMVPFHISVSDGNPQHHQEAQLSSVDFSPTDLSTFAPPRSRHP